MGDMPPELTSFVGRRAELHSIMAALAGARLVTLTGPGGCGKTRLAVQAARRTAGSRRDGAWWVELSPESDPDVVAARVADTVAVLLTSEASLARQLRDRELLIVLDNCEHLLESVAGVVSELLRGCPHVTVLATSREPLGVPGELVWRVPPLDTHDAITLFNDRSAVQGPDEAVRDLCRRLDGIPLALELAAAWTGTLSPREIAAELEDRFAVLFTGTRGAPPRHRTLEASMTWSHDLLGEGERGLFRRLGVFQHGFTLAAAQRVCGPEVLYGLRRLVDTSMLVADTGEGVTRYRMLETVRHYALDRLAAARELERTRRLHLAAYLALAEEAAPLLDTDKDAWRALVHADYPNLRAALEWGLTLEDTSQARSLAAALAWLWHLEGRRAEGLGLLRLAAERGAGEHSALQARVLTGLALVADTTHPLGPDFDAARVAAEMARVHGDVRTAALAGQLSAIGLLATDLEAVRAAALETRADPLMAEHSDVLLGLVSHLRDEHEQAMALLGPAAAELSRRHDRGVAATAFGFAALSAAYIGDLPGAEELARQGVDEARPLPDYHRNGSARGILAVVLVLRGRPGAALEALDPVIRLVEEADHAPFVPWLAKAAGLAHLYGGRAEAAVEWFRREADWLGAGRTDADLTPETQILLAAAQQATGDLEAARRTCATGLERARALGLPRLIADGLAQQARLAEPERALELHHEALDLRARHGLRPACLDSLDALALAYGARGSDAVAARLRGACDRLREDLAYPRAFERYGKADPQGRELDLEAAIEYARRSRGTRGRPASGWDSLTPAERQVVQLAVEGLSNPEIGKRLFMSRSTVKTHLAHVYAKLGVANRTELAMVSAARERTP
ncbi:LuxR C-terminal-related transcriptional regulator [Nonomuraea sp. NPDC050536]|uniref:helix-turn-helix transcriptional regulator n=1 Tax=Nonomuraea sp. NPDC050536 TaxID=3364366 RepID=UPI0037C9C434